MQQKDQTVIYGVHPVTEALRRRPTAVRHVYFVTNHDATALQEQVRALGIPFDRCDEDHLPQSVDRHTVHQGVVALVTPSKVMVDYKTFLDELIVTPDTALLLLDELTDPQNVGAVIRSAAAFGVAGVLIPEHRQAQVTGTVVKVSAGMAFVVPLVQVGNVNLALRDLKDKGFWVYGLTEKGTTDITREQFTKPSLFVLGNEGYGMREKTETLCDFTLTIPIAKECESLNAAASAAVALYAWRSQHPL